MNLQTYIDYASLPLQHLGERAELELNFAEQLCEIEPGHADAWRPLIAQARAQMKEILSLQGLDSVPAVVAEIETILAPISSVAKSYTIHCVGHAHIDMNWMWSWPETVSVTIDTFSTVLRLMEEYPAFKFSQSQASIYAIVEQYRPAMLERIAQRVKEGRWEVTASHWVEGDKNMASGESLCRHLLYTRTYMERLFGLRPEDVPIDWAPDTFGHSARVPSYLVRGGVKYLYLHRPGVHSKNKPGAFWWEGPDGSRVLVRNDMELGYNGSIVPEVMIPAFFKFVNATGGRDFMFLHGVGDHGGGPTRRDILRALDMSTWPIFPAIEFSTARAFYERLEKQSDRLPVIYGELNTEVTGCYSSQSLIKKANRFAENRLVDAELAGAFAMRVAGHCYPAGALTEAWRDTLFSQFHDILPGSGVHDTRTYAHGLFQKTMATTSQSEIESLRLLASLMDTTGAGEPEPPSVPASKVADSIGAGVGFRSANGELAFSEQSLGHGPRPFLLFNPTSRDRAEVIEATVWDNTPGAGKLLKERSFAVRENDGTLNVPQVVTSGHYWGHNFLTLAFPAKAGGLGYSQFCITEESSPLKEPEAKVRQLGWNQNASYLPVERSVEGLENDCVRVELDPVTGGIRSLLDKRNGTTLIGSKAGAAMLEYGVEQPHPMSSWCVAHTGPIQRPEVKAIRRALMGPYKASLEVDLHIDQSTMTLTYELRVDDPKLYLHLKCVWRQWGSPETGVPSLRLAFPFALTNSKARYEIPFGAIDRPFCGGEELPALQWAQVTGLSDGKMAGCLLLNDSKHGHSLDVSTLRLTLIRSSYDPDILPEIGEHEVHLALQPFVGEMPVADAIHAGQEFNHALRVIGTDVHHGRLPEAGKFITIDPQSLILSAIKKAENGDGLVARVINPTGEALSGRIAFNAGLLGEVERVREVDLLERPLPQSAARVNGDAVDLAVVAGGIASVFVEFRNGA